MNLTPEEARRALAEADTARRIVADEAGAPTWYWWGLGAGWILIGVLAGLEAWWLTAAGTLVLGALHAAVGGRLMSGRYRSGSVRPSAEVAGRRTWLLMWLFLLAMGAVTVGLGFALAADGARHAAFFATLAPAAVVGFGGPHVIAWSARRSTRAAA